MKNIFYLSFTILSLISLSSCEDVLDKEPLNIISDSVVWDDEALVEAYIVRVYSQLQFRETSSQFYGINGLSMITDEARDGYTWHNITTTYKPGLTQQNENPIGWWGYGAIRQANEFFVQMETSSLPESTKNEFIGRMQFARAFMYFTLVKRFGGVPIITVPQAIDASYDELYVSRNTEMEVYDFIISELDSSIEVLPDVSNAQGWPTKYSALAFKSRAALYAASISEFGDVDIDGLVGVPSSDAQRFWEVSYDASNEIIQSGAFQLYNNYPDDKVENFRNLFLDEETNPEIIFSKQYTGIPGITHSWDLVEFPLQFGGNGTTNVYLEMVESFENIDGSSGELDRNLVTSTTWNLQEDLFANKDPRFHASIFFEGSDWQGGVLGSWQGLVQPDGEVITDGQFDGINAVGDNASLSNTNGMVSTGFNVKKYADDNMVNPIVNTSSTDYIVFRYGEILLNHAEAAFEINNTDQALSAVNQIRERAGIVELSSISRDQIRQERKVELAFEGHRIWDLKRWRTATTALTRQFSGIETLYDVNSGDFQIEFIDNIDSGGESAFYDRHYYYPITPNRIANNPNLAPENPGW